MIIHVSLYRVEMYQLLDQQSDQFPIWPISVIRTNAMKTDITTDSLHNKYKYNFCINKKFLAYQLQ